MIDREKVLTVLRRRFPGATPQTVAAAANAIMGLSEEWEEVALEPAMAVRLIESSVNPSSHLSLDPDAQSEYRIFRRQAR